MKAAILWTGGKDSCIALHETWRAGHQLRALVTFTPENPEFLAHPLEVIKLQAEALRIGHLQVQITPPYKESYVAQLRELKKRYGIGLLVSGDIDEIDGHASWMEDCCAQAGIELRRPLWKMPREHVFAKAKEYGLHFLLSCVKPPFLEKKNVGSEFYPAAMEELQQLAAKNNFDPCGENGEYHTLVLDAALFRKKLSRSAGEVREKNNLYYLHGANYALHEKAFTRPSYPRKKIAMAWSGGKDSALALHRLQQTNVEIVALFTTITKEFGRVTMHGVREELIEAQAERIGLPLLKMYPGGNTNEAYENALQELVQQLRTQGVEAIAFGDIYLEDLRSYREKQLRSAGLEGIFPLWKEQPADLLEEFFHLGFRTITCCVSSALGEKRAGADLDRDFIAALPEGVDPCGENGEFHTFCFAGPVFSRPVQLQKGERILKALQLKTSGNEEAAPGFWYCDLREG